MRPFFAQVAGSLLVLAPLLSGCQREPDFDERYDAASKTIVGKAKEIDAELAGTPSSAPVAQPEPLGEP